MCIHGLNDIKTPYNISLPASRLSPPPFVTIIINKKIMVYRLHNKVQNYAWGGFDYIPSLLKIDNTAQEPFAEIWMGTHHRGESEIEVAGNKQPLGNFIADAPTQKLGEATASKFDNKLPYLFKVLDVNKMLSIQAHPTKAIAEAGFADENERGIPVTAKHRNYKDDNHKPEVMIALTDFWLLHGFKSIEGIEEVLATVPEFAFLQESFQDKDIKTLYQTIMELPAEQVNEHLAGLYERLKDSNLEKNTADYWARLGFEQHTNNGNFDKGIFSVYLYNLVNLKKGQGIYQAAGIPHAYLEGANIELMANSDNVLRGGLTVKHIDVPELLKHLRFEGITPAVMDGERVSDFEVAYPTVAPDFEVSKVHIPEGQVYQHQNNNSPETVIVIEGQVTVDEEVFGQGDSFFVPAGNAYSVTANADAELYKAYVPFR